MKWWNSNDINHHIAVISNIHHYIIVSLTFHKKTKLFTLSHYQLFPSFKGEFGSYYFINHKQFFMTIRSFITHIKRDDCSIALLFEEPFISEQPFRLAPFFYQGEYAISHPLALQCHLAQKIYTISLSTITAYQAAFQAAIEYTNHPYNDYSIDRLVCKKTGFDLIDKKNHSHLIAACGSYLMEHV